MVQRNIIENTCTPVVKPTLCVQCRKVALCPHTAKSSPPIAVFASSKHWLQLIAPKCTRQSAKSLPCAECCAGLCAIIHLHCCCSVSCKRCTTPVRPGPCVAVIFSDGWQFFPPAHKGGTRNILSAFNWSNKRPHI